MTPFKKDVSGEQAKPEEQKSFPGGLFLRILLGFLLIALGAFLLTLAFPPYGQWPLVFCGFVPILVSVHRLMPRVLAGVAMGLGVGGFFWGYFAGVYTNTNASFLEYLPFVVAFIFLLVGTCQRNFHAHTGYRWFVPEGAVVWTGFEMLRGLIPFLGTSAFLANPLYEQFWLIQPVSMLSIHGMSFLVIMINYVLAQKVLAFIDSRWIMNGSDDGRVGKSASQRWLYATIVLFLVWTGYSMSLIDTQQASVRVAAVQPGHYVHEAEADGTLQKVFRRSLVYQEDFDQLIEITRSAGERGTRLIVWNQAVLPFDPHVRGTDILQRLARELNAYIVIGYRDEDDDANEITILSPDGALLGDSYQTLIGSVGTATAHSLDFTDRIRELTREEIRLIAVPAREWQAVAPKRFPHIVFRAVENRVPIIKADAHYASAIVDSYGRIIRRSVSEESQRSILIADVPAGTGDAPAVSWGDLFGWICFAGMILFLAAQIRTALQLRQARAVNTPLS